MGVLEEGEARTGRLRVNCWASESEDGTPLLFVHGKLVSGRWFEQVAAHLPDDIRGLRDWSDDVAAVADALGWAVDATHLGINVVGTVDCAGAGAAPLNEHGTMIAGVAGTIGNGIGVVGIAQAHASVAHRA